MFKPRFICAAVCAVFVYAAPYAAPPAGAQALLEEVIVTAQKREQSLQDVPIAVTAFTGERLVESGIRDFFEVSNIDPALIVGKTQTSTTASFSIRGVFTSSQNFGLESSVGLYVDGVYRARQSAMINNLVDIAAIEVLRGPQGTLFGRNTPSGAVSMSSRRPDFNGEGYLDASAGQYDLRAIDGAKSFTLIEDELAIRATGFYMERGGFVDVPGIGSDVLEDRDRWGGRLQALWQPNDDISVHVIADYSEIDEICCAVGNWVNNLQAQQLPPGASPVLGTDNNVIAAGGTVIDQDDFYGYEVTSSFLPSSQNQDQGLSVQFDWALPGFDLTSITAYREFDSFDRIDGDFYDIDALIRTNDAAQNQFSQELRISNEGEKFTYVAGLFYFAQELDSLVDTVVGADTGPLVGVPAFLFPAGGFSRNVAGQEHRSYAVFGQVDYNLSESIVLTGGLRWTREDKEMVNIFTEENAGLGFPLFPPLAPRDDVDEDLNEDQVTGTAKISYFFNDDVMLYLSYGTGYKAGGINTDRIAITLDVGIRRRDVPGLRIRHEGGLPRAGSARQPGPAPDRYGRPADRFPFRAQASRFQNAGVAESLGRGAGSALAARWMTPPLTLAYAYNNAEYADFERGELLDRHPLPHADCPTPVPTATAPVTAPAAPCRAIPRTCW
jgi:iron complex outermembrane receptor protein